MRGIVLLSLCSVCPFFAAVQPLTGLPAGVSAAIQIDAAGNVYVAGSTAGGPFAAKMSPDGAQIVWITTLPASANDLATALAIGADGSVYLTGTALSNTFATTAGSLQPVKGSTGTQAFAAKLDPKGAIVYATYLGGTTFAQGNAIAVDSAGHAFVTGITTSSGSDVFPVISSIAGETSATTGFIVELNAAGSAIVVGIRGLGGSQIFLDPKGNIYAAGAFASSNAPVSAGAFQATVTPQLCGFTMIFRFPCSYQHVAKIDSTGTHLLFGTYLAGVWDSRPSGIAVDALGNVIVAGSARGADYPVTPGAYQSLYTANPVGDFQPVVNFTAPVTAGYVTKLNPTGTALLWSTYLSGSGSTMIDSIPQGDTINSMAIDAAGNIVVGGFSRSSDLPGLWTTPVASRPSPNGSGFIARLSSDGGKISATQLTPSQVNGVAIRSDGTTLIAAGLLAAVTFPADGRVYAIADPADNARVVNVAPGQLLTLYGTNLAPASAAPASGFPTSFNGVTVTFNGIPGPILYTSGIQINLQVPYEIAGQTQVTMNVSSTLVSPTATESYTLGVIARQPSVFLAADNFSGPLFGTLTCNSVSYSGVHALALNRDGTVNSCANPAFVGSNVNLFVNGIGVTSPAQSTGAISPATPVALTPAVVLNATPAPASAVATVASPGTISGLTQFTARIDASGPAAAIPLVIDGVRMREQNLVVWVKPVN